jgi:hypothetical protein
MTEERAIYGCGGDQIDGDRGDGLYEQLSAGVERACTCPPEERPNDCRKRYDLGSCRAVDLYERLHAVSKVLEASGRLDERENPGAHATVLETMRFLRLYCGA